MRQLLAALALTTVAFGGARQGEAQVRTRGVEPAGSAGEERQAESQSSGTVHEIRMELVDGQYRYEPASLTIKVGDTVRWLNISGFPHNVAFYEDKIPEGAAEPLNELMPDKMQKLSGVLLTQPNQSYEITFEGVPTGEYEYYCVPHEMLGMVASLTVEE